MSAGASHAVQTPLRSVHDDGLQRAEDVRPSPAALRVSTAAEESPHDKNTKQDLLDMLEGIRKSS